MLPAYAELHCLSNFSFLRGASHPEELVERAHALGYGAIAITDECSVAGVVRAHLAAKEIGQKLLIGSELTLLDGLKLVLLATDRDSYGDLSQLITRGRRAAVKGRYALTRDDVGSLASRCLALWMPADPVVTSDEEAAHDAARWVAEVFGGHAWIAVELFAQAGDVSRLARLEALGRDTGLPLVAAGDVHMHARARRALQDTLTAIRLATPLTQCGYVLHGNGERHLRSRGRLATIYPRALTDATLDVAQRCEFSLDALRYEYPREIVPEGETPASWLRKLTEHGLAQRYGPSLQPSPPSPQPSPPLRVEREYFSVSGDTGEAPSPQPSPPLRAEREFSSVSGGTGEAPSPQPSPPLRVEREFSSVSGGTGEAPSPQASAPLRAEREYSSVSGGTIEAPSPRRRGSDEKREGWGEGAFADKGSMLRGDHTFRCTTAPPEVRELIEHELGLIAELAYEPYFLTVQDIVAFARSQDILCQGRGSAANSAVCYALGITEVDPARMSMLFERFISKERNEPPDIDVDFEHQRREEVMQYVYRKYGRDRAALAATLITYRPKSAVRDVGKALGLDLAQVDRLAGVFAWWDGRVIQRERIREAGFDPDSPTIKRLIKLSSDLMGFPRHLSQHVGGFVIARTSIERMVPVENAAMEDRTVIQWDKDDLDAMGLLKVDCLALGMLSAIRRALQMIGKSMRVQDIPSEDPAVYEMIQHADTIGVFQIESRAQQSMLPRLRPRNYYDLVIEVAIVRPGPIQGGMVHPYLRRRQGLEPVTYPSDAVKAVLERTLGVPIFQEQVMQLAIVAAGFTPGEADRLRRSMAAWRRKGGLEQFEQRLIDGMSARGLSESFARQIYQQILGFGEYGFPESHSASFAMLVYVSCWLKRYHPAAFTGALLNSQPMGFYAPAQLVADARHHGVEVRPVDVTVSDWDCTLEEKNRETPGPRLHGDDAEDWNCTLEEKNRETLGPRLRGDDAEDWNCTLEEKNRETLGPRLRGDDAEDWNCTLEEKNRETLGPRLRGDDAEDWDCTLEEKNRETLGSRFRGSDAEVLSSSPRRRGPSVLSLDEATTPLTPETWGLNGPALRLGLRMIAGLTEAAAMQVVAARAQAPFATVADLAHRTKLDRRDLEALADAGALSQLAGHRHDAVWDVAGVERLPALIAGAGFDERAPDLVAPTEGQDIVADYRRLGLSLRRHPLELLRMQLTTQRLATAADVRAAPHGRLVRTAGIVIGRQRPDTASGVVFVTLEDETGTLNVIVWRDLGDRQRRELLGSRLMGVYGKVEREGEVVHVLAGRLVDFTPMLGALQTKSRDFH